MRKTCTECGKKFEAKGRRKVCGDACAEVRNRRYGREHQALYYQAKKSSTIALGFSRICRECGEEFIPADRRQRICQDACRKAHAKRLNAEYRRSHGMRPSGRIRTEPVHTAGGVSDDPRTEARDARVAGLAGKYAANTAILERVTGKGRNAIANISSKKADEILKGIQS
jgi:hypothetical protein